jgi:hypothetical protein
MFRNIPRRCPFLRGKLYGKTFKGVRDKGKGQETLEFDFRCDLQGLLFNVHSQPLNEYGCLNGKFEWCECYAARVFELTIAIPLTCPIKKETKEKCSITNKECSFYWIEWLSNDDIDYRRCAVFSAWFWEKRQRKDTSQ